MEPPAGITRDTDDRRTASSGQRRRRRWLPLLLAGLLGVLVVGGLFAWGTISGVRVDLTAGPAAFWLRGPADTGAQREPTEVEIGIGAPLTGGSVTLGRGVRRGVELAIAQANERADVQAAGIRFVGVPGDDRGDAGAGVAIATELASHPNLLGVVGHLNSEVSIPASAIYAEKRIVMISPASTDPLLTQQGLPTVFRVCGTDTIQGPALADFATTSLGYQRAYVVDDSTPYGEALASEFAERFDANGGKIVGRAKTSDQESDFGALAARIAGYGPDVICYGGMYTAGSLLTKQVKDAGVRAPLMGGDGLYDEKYIERAGAARAEGDYCVTGDLPPDRLPNGVAFKAAFAKRFPVASIEAYDAYGYDAANVLIDAVVEAAKADRDGLMSPDGRDVIVRNVSGTDTMGATGKLAFDFKGDATTSAFTLHVVRSGSWIATSVAGDAGRQP